MRNYEIDLFGLDPLVNYGRDYLFCGCNKVYKDTNERLKDIYSQFDFKGKNVYSVLSSGDQVFSAYYFGARNVDTFDNNWATYYYFYLKKWYLMFYHKETIRTQSEILLNSIEMYDKDSEEERNVYKIWKELLLKYANIEDCLIRNDFYDHNVPYCQDITPLLKVIKNKRANFTELNIFKRLKNPKKYDIVILSNILENVYPEDEYNRVLCQNLDDLLNEDGVVICSVLNDRYRDCDLERGRAAFRDNYTYELSDVCGYNMRLNKEMPLFYTYKKK